MKLLVSGIVMMSMASILSSCLLEKDRDNFVNVSKQPDLNNMADITYSYTGWHYYPMKDTVWLTGSESLGIKLTDGNIFGYELTIDDILTLSGDNIGPFYIEAKDLQAGTHKIKITVFAKSGTKSLADKLQAEYFSYVNEYVLIVGDVDFTPQLERIVLEDGTVQIKWNRYPYGDFQAYEIRKYGTFFGFYEGYRTLTVTDREQLTLTDSTYVGDYVYYVATVDRGGKYIFSKDIRKIFPYNTGLTLTRISDQRLRLSWNEAPFYKNIKSVTVRHGATILGQDLPQEQHSIEFDDNTTLFGKLDDYSISLKAKVDDPGKIDQDEAYFRETISIGKRTPPFNDIQYNIEDHAYYIFYVKQYYSPYPDAIYKLDKDLNIIDSVKHNTNYSDQGHLAQSASGNHLYFLYSSYIVKIDRSAMSMAPKYFAGIYLATSKTENCSVSDNNFLMFEAHDRSIRIINPDTDAILLDVKGVVTSAHISPDGQYAICDKSLYHFDGGAFTLLQNLSYSNIQYVRFLNNETKVLIATSSSVILYDYITGIESNNYAYATPLYSSPYYDQLTYKYCLGNGYIDIRDGSTHSIPFEPYGYALKFAGEYLFASSGFGLKL